MSVFPTGVSTDADLSIAVNNLACTLNGAIDNVVTTITVNSTTGFPTAGYITIDAEIIKYTGLSGGVQFTGCTRGADGTTNVSHSDLTTVYHNIVAAHHNALKDEVKAIEQNLSDRIGLGSTDVNVASGDVKIGLGGTGNATPALRINGGSGSSGGPFIILSKNSVSKSLIGTDSAIFGGTSDDTVIQSGTGMKTKLYSNNSSTPDLVCNAGEVSSASYTDYFGSLVITGWSSPTGTIYVKKVGKTVYMTYDISGTSNSTSTSFTLPYTLTDSVTAIGYARDNGGTAVAGLISATGATATFRPSVGTSGWTASGTKSIAGQFWFQATV